MQTSPYHLLPKVLDVVALLNPKQILDLGCGDGFVGLAIKRYINPSVIIDGVDKTLADSSWLKATYRHLEASDIRKGAEALRSSYDLILVLETLHNLSKRDGKKLLKDLIRSHGGVLASADRDQWDKGDFAELGNTLFLFDAERTLVYLTKNADAIKSLRKNRITTKIIRGAKSSKTMTRILKRVTTKTRKA